jgi:phospholipase D1/2
MECQNRTISRGSASIFSRLRKEGIDVSWNMACEASLLSWRIGADEKPEEYMTFFSLRGWGKHKSGVLTTEQVYIHGKTCIIDDRKSAPLCPP